MIYVAILLFIILWKFSEIHKGWLLFWAATSIIVALRGTAFNIVTLAILVGLGKVAIDIYDAGK